jgi:hypothetical protein
MIKTVSQQVLSTVARVGGPSTISATTKSIFLRSMSTHLKLATEATFETKPNKLHRLTHGPSNTVTVTREEALKMYTQMLTIRKLEAVCNGLYKEKLIRGFCHLYSGEEACGVGIKA